MEVTMETETETRNNSYENSEMHILKMRRFDLNQSEPYYLTAVVGVLTLVGVLGNTLVILSYIMSKQCRKARFLFLFNMSISDLLICLIHNPMMIASMLKPGLVLASSLCMFVGACLPVCSCVSLYMMIMLAINRQIMLHHGRIHAELKYTRNMYRCLATLGWAISFVIYGMVMLSNVFGDMGIDVLYRFCSPVSYKSKQIYTAAIYFLLVVHNLVIMGLYASIYRQMAWCDRTQRPQGTLNTMRQYFKFRKAIKGMSIICSIYSVCYFPVFALAVADFSKMLVPPQVHRLAFVLCLVPSATNAFTVVRQAPEFCRAFHSIWLCYSPNRELADVFQMHLERFSGVPVHQKVFRIKHNVSPRSSQGMSLQPRPALAEDICLQSILETLARNVSGNSNQFSESATSKLMKETVPPNEPVPTRVRDER